MILISCCSQTSIFFLFLHIKNLEDCATRAFFKTNYRTYNLNSMIIRVQFICSVRVQIIRWLESTNELEWFVSGIQFLWHSWVHGTRGGEQERTHRSSWLVVIRGAHVRNAHWISPLSRRQQERDYATDPQGTFISYCGSLRILIAIKLLL